MATPAASRFVATRTHDRLLLLANRYNIPVSLYKSTDVPYTSRTDWSENFLWAISIHTVFLVNLSFVLFLAAHFLKPASYRRATVALAGFFGMLYWPIWVGDTGIPTLNFGVPALAFLVTLHIVDIFFVRPPEEVAKWGPLRFMAQLIAFPNESPDQNPFRMIYRIPNLLLQAFFANVLLYLTPSPAIYASLKPWSWPFIFYNATSGLMVLILLGFVVDVTFLLITGSTWMEMHPLFRNPLGASVSMRDFWSRWNQPVKASLGAAVFKLMQSDQQAPVSRRLRKDVSYASDRFLPGFTKRGRQRFADHLDETETELDSAATSAANSPAVSEDESSGNRRSLRRRPQANGANGVQVHQMTPAKPASKPASKATPKSNQKAPGKKDGKKRTGLFMKMFAALSTFFVSGLYHEYMDAIAFGPSYATGETLLFFMLHGLCMCGTVVYAKSFPKLVPQSNWLCWFLVQGFLFSTTPFFCGPFLRFGFFESIKSVSLFNDGQPIAGFIHLAG